MSAFAAILPAALLIQQAEPVIPHLETSGFEFRSCAKTDTANICSYAAAPPDGYDILYLVVREEFYMVMARTVQCKGEFSSKMEAGKNHFYTPSGNWYRMGDGAGFEELLLSDYRLVCRGGEPNNPLSLRDAVADGQARLAKL